MAAQQTTVAGSAPNDAGTRATSSRSDWVAGFDDDDELMTGEAVVLDLRPTGFGLRAAGLAIDWLVYFGGFILLTIVVFVWATPLAVDPAIAGIVSISLLVLCLIVAPTAVELASNGRSLGKLAVGGRIVRDDGGAIGFRHAFIRALVGLLEVHLTLGAFAALVGLLSGRSKRIGDHLAGTYCQYERVAKAPQPLEHVPPSLEAWATIADVGRMPARLGRRIRQYLTSATLLTPERRAHHAQALAAEAGAYVSPLPAGADPWEFLVAVTILRRDREARALELRRRQLEFLEPALVSRPHGFPER